MVRGSSKLARGNVHPSDVVRALMVDLENVGVDVRGVEVEKKLFDTQKSIAAYVASITPTSTPTPTDSMSGLGSGSMSVAGSGLNLDNEIGRASCRERVSSPV